MRNRISGPAAPMAQAQFGLYTRTFFVADKFVQPLHNFFMPMALRSRLNTHCGGV